MDEDVVDATRARRTSALRDAGFTQAQLAARIGVSRQSVGLVLAGHHRSRRVEQAIADACGATVGELFPYAAPRALHDVEVGSAGAGRERARGTEAHPAAMTQAAPSDLESVLNGELRALADRVLIAVAAGDLDSHRPIVRAVAAAVRALAG